MTHTPGPWNYAGPSDIGRDSYSIYGSGPSNAVMVSMAYTAGPSDYGDAAEANARLIASAPELLEACEVASRFFEENDDFTDGEYPIPGFILDMRIAIKKATGRRREEVTA
jgi:hypothetical protein